MFVAATPKLLVDTKKTVPLKNPKNQPRFPRSIACLCIERGLR